MADLFDRDPDPTPVANHVCGHGFIYHDGCRSCLVAEIAMMPRVAGQRWLRGLKTQHGRSYAEALGREVAAYRERWAGRLAAREAAS